MIMPPYGRKNNIRFLFKYLSSINNPYIVEIGMTRNLHKLSWKHDGYFTLIVSWYLHNYNKGKLISVDIDHQAIRNCKFLLNEYYIPTLKTQLICDDAFNIKKYINKKIDVLYLDAWDYTISNPDYNLYIDEKINSFSEKNHLEIFKVLENDLNHYALVIIDDVLDINDYTGKGKLLIPYLLDKGYRIIPQTLKHDKSIAERQIYQLILQKR